MVTMSEREGRFVPLFYALIVRNVRIVDVGNTSVGVSSGPISIGSPCGVVRVSMWVCPAAEGDYVGSMSRRVDFPEVVGGCPTAEDMGSSSGWGEPGGE
jgi:hypothetical protein